MSEGPPGPASDADPPPPGPSALPGLAAFATMGTTIAICVALGVILGLWADRTWGTAPGGLILGIVLGTVAAVVSIIKQVRRFL